MVKIGSSVLSLLGIGCIIAGVMGILAASYGGGGGALLLGGWLIQKDGIGKDKKTRKTTDSKRSADRTRRGTEPGETTNEQPDLASEIFEEFTNNLSSPDKSGYTARELRSLDDDEFTNLMDSLIIAVLEDDGYNYTEVESNQGLNGFIGHLDDVTAFVCSARPHTGSKEALNHVVREVQNTLNSENIGADFVLCFTDVDIREDRQREMFRSTKQLIISEEQTRSVLAGN